MPLSGRRYSVQVVGQQCKYCSVSSVFIDGQQGPLYTFYVADSAEGSPLEIGYPAPAYSLLDDDGDSQSLHDQLADGPLVIVFYRGDW